MRKGKVTVKMLTSVLIKLGLAVFAALPVERIVAILLNRWLDRIDAANMSKAVKTAGHLNELAALFTDILADKQLTEGELAGARDAVLRARTLLMGLWAKGEQAKSVQTELGMAGVGSAYAEPLPADEGKEVKHG